MKNLQGVGNTSCLGDFMPKKENSINETQLGHINPHKIETSRTYWIGTENKWILLKSCMAFKAMHAAFQWE